MHPSLSAPLDAAFSGVVPDGALPPGPRTNQWGATGAAPDAAPEPFAALIDALWRPGGFHRRPDGTATSIRMRPVPSAGGCDPVRTHLVSVDGTRRAVDHATLAVLRRDTARDLAAGWPSAPDTPAGSHLVFTVLPGRTFGRYRHRAWPLWIADVAYAVAAVRFLLADHSGVETFGPSAHLRSLLGVPRAADAAAWTSRGLVPEIPLAAIEIADAAAVAPERRRSLRHRRSPSLAEFIARAGSSPSRPEVDAVATASGQAWVRGASAVESWSVPSGSTASELAAALWTAHLAAAERCYAAAYSGAARTRPVSGFAPTGDRWILHAVATIATPGGRHS